MADRGNQALPPRLRSWLRRCGVGLPPYARGQLGQASVELIAGLPALLLAGLVCLQLLAAGYALTLVDGAAEAGALARAVGRPVEPAVRESLPGWARERIRVAVDGGRVGVKLRPPSPFAAVAEHLEVSSSAWVRRG